MLAACSLAIAWLLQAPAAAPSWLPQLAPPVQLQADGMVLDVAEIGGHASPLLADITGDGVPELLVGAQRGNVAIYIDIGTRAEPRWSRNGLLEVKGQPVELPHSSGGIHLQLADLDDDRDGDLVAASGDGSVYWLEGYTKQRFALPQLLRDRSRLPVRLGRYYHEGKLEWVIDDKNPDGELRGVSASAVDWDADGDLDLLLGASEGRVVLRLNLGTSKRYAFANKNTAIEVAGVPFEVPSGRARPIAADWDGDGLFDVLSGSEDGAAYAWRNVGEVGTPRFAEATQLFGTAKERSGLATDGTSPPSGPFLCTQLHVCDYDGDGDLDLLVGDARYDTPPPDSEKKVFVRGFAWLLRREPVAK